MRQKKSIAYIIGGKYSISMACLIKAITGFCDGTVELKLSIIIKAYNGINLQEGEKGVNFVSGFIMLIIAVAFVFGTLLLREIM